MKPVGPEDPGDIVLPFAAALLFILLAHVVTAWCLGLLHPNLP